MHESLTLKNRLYRTKDDAQYHSLGGLEAAFGGFLMCLSFSLGFSGEHQANILIVWMGIVGFGLGGCGFFFAGLWAYVHHDRIMLRMSYMEAGQSLLTRGNILELRRQSLIRMEAAIEQLKRQTNGLVDLRPVEDYFARELKDYEQHATALVSEQEALAVTIREVLGIKPPPTSSSATSNIVRSS